MPVTHGQFAKIETEMTVPLLGLGGRRRTNPCWFSQARHITWKWAFPTELFQTEREENPKCQFKPTPNDTTNPEQTGLDVLSDIEKFAAFMRFLAPPTPSQDEPGGAASISRGKKPFAEPASSLGPPPPPPTGTL